MGERISWIFLSTEYLIAEIGAVSWGTDPRFNNCGIVGYFSFLTGAGYLITSPNNFRDFKEG